MSNPLGRSRSNTSISTKSNSHRPLSRASTTSVHSFDHNDTQRDPQPQYHHHASGPVYTQQPYNSGYVQPDPAMLLQAANATEGGLAQSQVQQLVDHNQFAVGAHPGPLGAPVFNSQDAMHTLQGSLGAGHPVLNALHEDVGKKKGSASGSAANDKELREMLMRNDGRALKDVAAEVIATDRTSKAEKSKQLFAMLWLKGVTRAAKTSVPRNRVYSKYAERCGTERVIPLNPASFGKLVRVIFPGIQTRRLGVRGESKYHYVDLALINDTGDDQDSRRGSVAPPSRRQMQRHHSVAGRLDLNSVPKLPADTAAFPPQVYESPVAEQSRDDSEGRVFANHHSNVIQGGPTSASYTFPRQFATPQQLGPEGSQDMSITLPDINSYLPPGTDQDDADALSALFRTHCTSLVDAMRYCKEKQFWRLFTQLQGTLTVPVQRLFAQPEIAPWVKECDWLMYKKMILNVSQLTLQVAPPAVLKFMDSIAKNLHAHICKNFGAMPAHLLEARLEPAALFTHLLRQCLRVNQTAHAAAVVIMPDTNRDQMWADFCSHVNVKRIIEMELPASCDYHEAYRILTEDVRKFLLPLNTDIILADGTHHREPVQDVDMNPDENVIDRIARFLSEIPARFPGASAWDILKAVSGLSSAAIREMTVENGLSFQGWWLTKVFIDEYCHWMASLGGFLNHAPPSVVTPSRSPTALGDSMMDGLVNGSSRSSVENEYDPNASFISNVGGTVSMHDAGNSHLENNSRGPADQYDTQPFPTDYGMSFASSQLDQNNEDSGIALMEDGIDQKFASTMRSQLSQQMIPQHLSAGVR